MNLAKSICKSVLHSINEHLETENLKLPQNIKCNKNMSKICMWNVENIDLKNINLK